MGLIRRALRALVLAVAGAALLPAPASAQREDRPPTPELNFAVDVAPRPCALEGDDPYERAAYDLEGWQGPDYERYPGACQRLRFSYGPILVKPGQNDVLIEPVRIEKPLRNGYITRFRPNLVRTDGTVPPVEQVHLHHGVWLSLPAYGSDSQFFASGEEKTIFSFPQGYGMPVKATDAWLLLYMVHSAVPDPMEAYITYDIDFIPEAKAKDMGMKRAHPVWLDVRPSAYPVFNVQRDFGGADGRCTWPREQCAAHDPFGRTTVGQGRAGNGLGEDLQLPAEGRPFGPGTPRFTGGTLIGIGGHLHPGGIQNEIDLVRGGESTRIYTGEAAYWRYDDNTRYGGPPTSWDFSIKALGLPYWGVHVEPGDVLRSNATYDTRLQSTYEDMGIAVALFAPDNPDGTPSAPGVDPFAVAHDRSDGCESMGLHATTRSVRMHRHRGRRHRHRSGRLHRHRGRLHRHLGAARAAPKLCEVGRVTHGHLAENANHGGPRGTWSANRGSPTNDVAIGGFLYEPGDLSTLSMTGLPTVRLGSKLRFTNLEGGLIYHTITSCGFPCLGATGSAFPLADGSTSAGRAIDFDSSEVALGTPGIGPASQTLNWSLPVTQEAGYSPGEIVTYYCRIHPFMRGAFEVAR